MKPIPFFIATALVAAAGCAVGPSYHPPAPVPAAATPVTFSDHSTNASLWKVAEPGAAHPRGEWWRIFADDQLDRLETLALTNNQDLAAASARLAQAHDLALAARSEFYPQLTAGGTPGGDIVRDRSSQNAAQDGLPAGRAYTYSDFTAPLYLGWEMDLWGRVRNLARGAQARSVAAGDDLESARLAVTTEVANDYFTWLSLEAEHTLVTNTIVAYQRSLDLTQNRRQGGVASDLDVSQAATQLHTAEGQLPVIELSDAQTLHALALLCGVSPVDFNAINAPLAQITVPQIPSVVPSALLEQRPDIASAERSMAAANADIGVAQAAFYPTVKIDGLAGFQSVSFDSWFNWPSRFWSVGPSITVPLFVGGFNRAHLAATKAAYDETVANYRGTVLNAFVEVEDTLAAQRLLARQWTAENAALVSARQTLQIANNRYQAGLVTYLDVVTAQTAALNLEQTVDQLAGQRLAASVNLVKALGGGWANHTPDQKFATGK